MSSFEDLMWDMLKDKPKVLGTLMEDISQCQTYINGLEKFMDTSKKWEIEDLQAKLPLVFKVMKRQSITIRAMLMILLVYVSGGNFDVDTAQVLTKLGKGQDALKEIFKQKMEGL